MAISSGNITDELIQKYIEEQEGEPVEAGQFQIDSRLCPSNCVNSYISP
jgi:putative transposase